MGKAKKCNGKNKRVIGLEGRYLLTILFGRNSSDGPHAPRQLCKPKHCGHTINFNEKRSIAVTRSVVKMKGVRAVCMDLLKANGIGASL